MNDQKLEALLRQLSAAARSGAGAAALMPALLSATPTSLHEPLKRALVGGGALSQSLGDAGVLDAGERALLEAGERSGRMPEVLTALAETIRERRRARFKLLAGLAYPALVVVLAGFLLTAPLAVTRGVGAWLAIAVWPLLLVAAAVVVSLVVWPRLPKGSALRAAPAAVVGALPIIGPGMQRAGLGAFCELLAQLVAAGLPYTLALPAAMRAWPQTAPHEDLALRTLAGGASLADTLRAVGVVPERILRAVAVAEQSGTVDEALRALGRYEVESGRRFTLGLAAVLGGLVFLVVAVGIGATIIYGAQTYIEQIDGITADP